MHSFESCFVQFQLQYNENPEDFRSEVTTFTTLRNDSCVKILTNGDIGLKNMKRYYCQLAFFRNRFKGLKIVHRRIFQPRIKLKVDYFERFLRKYYTSLF